MIKLKSLANVSSSEIQRLADNYAVARNLRDSFPHPYTLADAQYFKDLVNTGDLGTVFALFDDDTFIGVGSIIPHEGEGAAELGYWLGEPFWGKGFATAAAQQLLTYAFQELDFQKVYAYVFAYNPASMRVLEKVGFTEEAILAQSTLKEGEYYDEYRFSINRP